MNRILRLVLPILVAFVLPAYSETIVPDLRTIADPGAWRVVNRVAKIVEDEGRSAVRLDAKPGNGLAWLTGPDFAEGTIELDLRGRDTDGRSFVGIAFHGADDQTYDAIYFRPFNFRNPDVSRRARAVQYVALPGADWWRLRDQSPGRYEAEISPAPDPNEWFHARIVVADRIIRVYVNGAPIPSLVVTALSERRAGRVGLWVGNNSDGFFANLKISSP